MVEISNKTISLLLIATIAIYVGGTFISLNRLSQVGLAPTGFVTAGPANVSVSITSAVSVEWIVGTINWSAGTINSTCNNCTMFTNASQDGNGYETGDSTGSFNQGCCLTFNIINQSLLLRNTGNNNVSLQFNLSKDTNTFFSGELGAANLSWRVVPIVQREHNQSQLPVDTLDSCGLTDKTAWRINGTLALVPVNVSTLGAGAGNWITSELVNGESDNTFICGNSTVTDPTFAFAGAQNEAQFDFRVIIDQSQGPGAFSTIATVVGTSS